MDTITTLLYTQQEVDFLLYQVGRYGVDAGDLCVLSLQRYGSDGGKPLTSGPGARYFGLQGAQGVFVAGLYMVVHGRPPAPVFLGPAERKGLGDIFFSMGIPEAEVKKYVTGIRQGGMLMCIRVYSEPQKKHICAILGSANDSNVSVFRCPLGPVQSYQREKVKENQR